MMTSFFLVSVSFLVSNFAGLGLEAKVATEIGIGLGIGRGKILQFRSSMDSYKLVSTTALITVRLFSANSRSFSCPLFILTILLDKCQRKRFFEHINILIKAILKFCTTNQLFVLCFNRKLKCITIY